MTTFTKELDEILKKRTWWGDYQNDDGTWGTGISNRPELIKAILNLVSERIIGENVPNDGGEIVRNVHGEIKGRGTGSYMESCRRELREEQRTTLYEGIKEEK